jgi:hypothetical protein
VTRYVSLLVILLTFNSCSTLVGNVKPIDEKSTDYGVLDLAREQPDKWKRLDVSKLRPKDAKIGTSEKAFAAEITDIAYQSIKTSAIISLNSSCREGRVSIPDLEPYLRELLLGMTNVTEREEKPRDVNGVSGREGIAAGKMAGQQTKIHAIVLGEESCLYDLMYISRPDLYPIHEADFNRFVSSLRLR